MSKNKGVSALIWSSADKFLTNGVALLISIILARLIDPSEYGILATASIFTILLSLFVEPGMTSGLIQKKDSDLLDFSSILTFNLAIGGGLYILLFLLSKTISAWFELPELSAVIKVLGLQILIGSVNSVQVAYVQKNLLFKKYFICSFTSIVISAAVGIAMAYQGKGVWALVAYQLIKQAVNVVMVNILFHCRFGFRFSKERFAEMFPFSGKILFTKFVDQGYVELTQLLISKRFSTTQLAFYNKGKSFPDLVINSLNSALTNVMFPYFSGMQDEFKKLKETIRYSVRMTSFICIPMMIGLLACADNFVRVVLTERWMESVVYLRLVCIYNLWVPFSNIVWQSLKAIRKGGQVLLLETVKVVLNVVLLIVFLLLLKSPIAIALSIVVSYTISFFVECVVAARELHYGIRNIFMDVGPSLLSACCMGVVVYLVGLLTISSLVKLVLQVVSGLVVYIIFAIVLKLPQMQDIISKVKGVKHGMQKP